MNALTIDVVGTPAPQGSHRGYVVNGRAVVTADNKKTKPWRQDVVAAIQQRHGATIAEVGGLTGPLEVDIEFYLPRPGYHFGTGRNAGALKDSAPSYVEKKPDVDKLVRSTLDALTTSGLIRDDAQVARLTAVKRYADAATGARITITPLDPSPAAGASPVATAGEAPTRQEASL